MTIPANWKYYIPYVWDGDTATWEDIYILPDIPIPEIKDVRSIWLTIDSLAFYDLEPAFQGDCTRFDVLRLLGAAEFLIEDDGMVVRDEVLTKNRVVHWARVYLEHHGFPVAEMREASYDEFAGTNNHAVIVGELKAQGAWPISTWPVP